MRPARPSISFSLLLAFSSSSPAASDLWWEVASPHFAVMSDGSEKDARRIAEELELIRAVFARAMPGLPESRGPRLTVLAARDETSLRRLLPHLDAAGRRETPAGLFWRTTHRNFIVLRTDLRGDQPYEVVYHEYFHALMNPVMPRAPLWVQEGLAGLWENTVVTADGVETARPNRTYLAILKRGALIPLRELLAASADTAIASRDGELHRSTMFYAQSWALSHFILFGDPDSDLRSRMNGYLEAVKAGEDPVEAFETGVGSVESMEDSLTSYVRRFQFTGLLLERLEPLEASRFAGRKLAPSEAEARLGHYFALIQRPEEAEVHVRRALELAPDSGLAHETAGLLQFFAGQKRAARESFEAARRLDGSRALALYFLAQMTAERLTSLEELNFVRETFERAVTLDPSHAPSLSRLSLMYRGDSDKREAALSLSEGAAALAPVDPVAHTAYGIALKQVGRVREAARELDAALRLDPTSELAREELVEARAAIDDPLFGVWQYGSLQLWLRVDAEGNAFRCRVDRDGTLHWDEGRIDDDRLTWGDGGEARVSVQDGRLVLADEARSLSFDRSFRAEGPCGKL